MENICKNCKHWGAYFEFECDRISMDDKSGAVKDVLSGRELATLGVDVLDDSGLDAALVCGPEFGCKLFASK